MLSRFLLSASFLILSACSRDEALPPAGEAISSGQNVATLDATATVSGASATASTASSGPVVVYSSRQEYLIKPLFDRFTEETGIEIQLQTGEDGRLRG